MREIFRHELSDTIFSGRFLVSVLLMATTFLISLGMMNFEYEKRMENYEESFSLPNNQLFWDRYFYWKSENGNVSNSDTITLPMGVVKKPEPLLYFARGMDKRMRQSVEFVATFPIVEITTKPDQEVNLLKSVFAAPDLLFLVKVLVSLLATLSSFNLICQERERGTLKLMLVNNASRGSIFAGKFLGGLVSIWLAFTAAFFVYLLGLMMFTPVTLAGELWLRTGLIYLTSLLYISVFFSIGAAISSFSRKSAPSLIISLFAWLLIVFALPGISSLLAQQFVPVDSPQKVARVKLEKAQELERIYAEEHPEETDSSNTAGYGQRHDANRKNVNEALAKIDAEHQLRKENQMRLTTSLARISPVGSMTYLYTSLAGNGINDVIRYQDDLVKIREMVNDEVTHIMTSKEFREELMKSDRHYTRKVQTTVYDVMDAAQEMGFNPLNLEGSIENGWIDFLLLALFAIIPASITFIRFLSYDPR